MNSVTIRTARDTDGDAIAGLIAGAFAEYAGCVFDRAAEFPELDAIASHFAARGGVIWVAEGGVEGGKPPAVIGSLAIAPSGDDDAPAGTLELFKVYVAASARRRGVARALFDEARRHALAREAPEIRLWTDTRFLDAHRFYERCGFRRRSGPRACHDLSATWEYPYRLGLLPAGNALADLLAES
ncbi:GNAT family N-acetyltransferase [Ancylobacter amanitiformis]|uniref:Acetyltransferase n=1 Tax=Ancylobacter amanitiformis TaxID=217069 RepID=A0ABU0LUS0_9HYPH|nr:GNAT family N-acetyltransferase [Ancylobacter amanitiformis]MDQ0512414.1 putative acetyltransferase [Ancylobacter amanitiformis]